MTKMDPKREEPFSLLQKRGNLQYPQKNVFKSQDSKEDNENSSDNNASQQYSNNLSSLSLIKRDHKQTNNNRIKKLILMSPFNFLIYYCLTTFLLLLIINHVNSSSINANPSSSSIVSSDDLAKQKINFQNLKYRNSLSSLAKRAVKLRGKNKTRSSRVTVSTSYAQQHSSEQDQQNVNATFALTRRSHWKTQKGSNTTTKNSRSSIARPFYTKITSDDAVIKNYFPNAKNVESNEELQESKKQGQKKPSKLFSTAPLMQSSTDKLFLTTTSKSSGSGSMSSFGDSGPKIRLEPFFNILNTFQSLALGTSKEQKFSPSYQTIAQSIDENTKISRNRQRPSYKGKGTKGLRNKKNRNKNHQNERFQLEEENQGPIPIPLPKPMITPEDEDVAMTTEDGFSTTTYAKPILHPMDILNVAMPSTTTRGEYLPEAEALKSLESITKPSHGPYESSDLDVKSNNKQRRKKNKGDKKNRGKITPIGGVIFNNVNQTGPESRERQLRTDFFDNFHDSDVDLQADEAGITEIITASNIPSGYSDIPVSSHMQLGSDLVEEELNSNLHVGRPNRQHLPQPLPFSTLYPFKKEDISMASKYPVSFAYNSALGVPPSQFPFPYSKSKRPFSPASHYDHYHNNNYPPNYPYNNGYVNHPQQNHYGHNSYLPSPPPPPLPMKDTKQKSSFSSIPVKSTEETEIQASSSSNEKIGIMDPFEIFYKEYKILAWAAFFVATAFCILALLVYLYVNNPPTEVVTAKQQLQSMWSFMESPQILKFLERIVENNGKQGGSGKKKRKKYLQRMGSKKGSMAAEIFSAIKNKDL